MIIYPYRDAIEGIEEILAENKEETPAVKQRLARACQNYLDWVDENEDDDGYDEDDYDDDDEGMECVDDRGY